MENMHTDEGCIGLKGGLELKTKLIFSLVYIYY